VGEIGVYHQFAEVNEPSRRARGSTRNFSLSSLPELPLLTDTVSQGLLMSVYIDGQRTYT
jgi:hypothetical protein